MEVGGRWMRLILEILPIALKVRAGKGLGIAAWAPYSYI